MKKSKVLILTNSDDGEHTSSVIKALERIGCPFFRLDVDKVACGDTKVCIEYKGKSPAKIKSTFSNLDNSHLNLKEVGSIWYRRPFFYNSPINDPVQKKHAEKELDFLFEGLWRILPPDLFWMSNPYSLERARKKILQLEIAKELGFNIPRTLITNNPKVAFHFIKSCKNGAIYKNIHMGCLDYGDEAFVIPTTLLTPELVNNLNLINCLPGFFQENIIKKHELRVTVVGRKIFPIKIESQQYPETSIDWRNPKLIDKLNYSKSHLPNNVVNLILNMMDSFGLQFGAFDLAVDKSGNYCFFEVNANGQWYWLEHNTDLMISESIADTLETNRSF